MAYRKFMLTPDGDEGMTFSLGAVGGCADVVGFDVAAALSCLPFDSITAVIPSSPGVSMIVPVAPTPYTTPLGFMTIRTRVGAVQLDSVNFPSLAALHSVACTAQSTHCSHATAADPNTLRTVSRCCQLTGWPSWNPVNDVRHVPFISVIESIGPDVGAATADPAPPTDNDTANSAAPTTATPRRADLLTFKPVPIAVLRSVTMRMRLIPMPLSLNAPMSKALLL